MEQAEKRIALVTGGAKGIGAAIAQRLARQGLHVVVADIDEDGAAEQCGRIPGDATPLRLDVGSPPSVAACFAEVDRRFGRCDVLVNNAGIARTFPFLEFPLDNWQATMDINVTGTLLCSQHAGRLMARRGWGRIVSIASVAGLRAVGKGRTAYGTSKAAIIGLTRQMAAELSDHGITANAVAPGPVDTPLTQVLHSVQFRREYTHAIPAARYGLPEEIASAVAYLASEEAAYINGVVLPVDGGFMASGARPEAA